MAFIIEFCNKDQFDIEGKPLTFYVKKIYRIDDQDHLGWESAVDLKGAYKISLKAARCILKVILDYPYYKYIDYKSFRIKYVR